MHQTGKFDFFAEKGGRRGAGGEERTSRGCWRPGLPMVCRVALTARVGGGLWRPWACSRGAGGQVGRG